METERTHVLRRRIADGTQLLAQLDEGHSNARAALAVAAAEREELLALHAFLVTAAAALPPLSLEQWRALDLIERCGEAGQDTRRACEVHLLEMRLNRARYEDYASGIARMRTEITALEGDAPTDDATNSSTVVTN